MPGESSDLPLPSVFPLHSSSEPLLFPHVPAEEELRESARIRGDTERELALEFRRLREEIAREAASIQKTATRDSVARVTRTLQMLDALFWDTGGYGNLRGNLRGVLDETQARDGDTYVLFALLAIQILSATKERPVSGTLHVVGKIVTQMLADNADSPHFFARDHRDGESSAPTATATE